MWKVIKSSKLCLNYGMHFDVTNVTKKSFIIMIFKKEKSNSPYGGLSFAFPKSRDGLMEGIVVKSIVVMNMELSGKTGF